MIAELRHETQTVSVSEAESVSGSDSESEYILLYPSNIG